MEKLFVIKIGGQVIDDKQALQSFLSAFASLQAKKLLVHGGGKIATRVGDALGIRSKYEHGRRITDDDTIDLVTMVYGGLVNKKIVAQLQSMGCNALGLTGADANILPAIKRPVKQTDYGWVGDLSKPGCEQVKTFVENGLTPVVAPLTHDGLGHILNTNADTIASTLAVGLSAYYHVRLMYCFEKPGVLEDVNDKGSVITEMDPGKYARLLKENRLFEGIIPKLDNAFEAIRDGVKEVLIGDAGDLLKNAGDKTSGTLITA